ncbi:MAG: CAP domain-containing protein, partial [Pseudomonadota bacterium]
MSVALDSGTFANVVVDGTNRFRARYGLPTVQVNGALGEMATRYARVMAERNQLGHNVGSSLDERAGWVQYRGALGENVAAYGIRSLDDQFYVQTARDMVEGWINSPGHRANMLEGRWNEIGVGAALSGDRTIYGVQVFGEAFKVPDLAAVEATLASKVQAALERAGHGPATRQPVLDDMIGEIAVIGQNWVWPDDLYDRLARAGLNVGPVRSAGSTLTAPGGISTQELIERFADAADVTKDDQVGVPPFTMFGISVKAQGLHAPDTGPEAGPATADPVLQFAAMLAVGADKLIAVSVSNTTDHELVYQLDGATFT